MKKGFIFIFLCFGIASCDDIPNFLGECEYKYHLPLSKVVIEIIRYSNGNKIEEFALCYNAEIIKKFGSLSVKIGGNLPLYSQEDSTYQKTFLASGNFCYGDPIDGFSMFYTSKFNIQTLVSLDERPDLDPRNDGFISNLTRKKNNSTINNYDDFFSNMDDGIVIKSPKEYDEFKKKYNVDFLQNIDFSKNSVLGLRVLIGGCGRTHKQRLTKTPKGYEFEVEKIQIGPCRLGFSDLHFVLTPKISPGDLVTFKIKYSSLL
jgi:hypothetical protein